MAKRTRAKAAPTAKATKAVEPFFRPFEGLKQAVKQQKKKQEDEAKAAEAAKSAQGRKAAPVAAPAPLPARAAAPPAPPPRSGRAEDDAPRRVDPDTFAIYMAGVRALDQGRAGRIPTTAHRLERAAPGAPPPEDPDTEARERLRSLVIEGIRFEITDDGERLEGRRLDVDPREVRRLRHGRYGVDGRLDLHGRRAEEARAAVEEFVRRRQGDGDRVVALIHGKGNHSPGGRAVLRGEIAAWLSQGPAARHVAAFATAPEDDGGAGTLLVLLARGPVGALAGTG
ncbi:MAG TPA: Smr/MutS family protein [Candidatus Nanopelagicales bacterium]|nr:Smr/MutS family protein [Candidatus Nanopelagicales bacterium]